jgi:hypothetical protein
MRVGLCAVVVGVAVAVLAAVPACTAGDAATPIVLQDDRVDRSPLLSPRFCSECHPQQYATWSNSAHAYAGDDPVFRALNQRMQRETNGSMRTLCVQCHAPMALRLGATVDGTNLDEVPALKGVTCIFCHTVTSAHGTNNNPLELDPSARMQGSIKDPIPTPAHDSAYSLLLDGTSDVASGMCGPCHDIVTPGGAHIERTFREWATSRFGVGERTKTSCNTCHMPATMGRAAEVDGAPMRVVHDHTMPGVDIPITNVLRKEQQRMAVQRFLDDAIDARLCVAPDASGAGVEVTLRNRRVGHGWPSGSNQDRRAWIDLDARTSAGAVLFETGKIPDDRAVAEVADPNLFLLRDHVFDIDGKDTELFWRAVRFESAQLPAAEPNRPDGKAVVKTYRVEGAVAEVGMRLKIRPIDWDLIAELARSRDLDPKTIDPITTFTLGKTELTWRAGGAPCVE